MKMKIAIQNIIVIMGILISSGFVLQATPYVIPWTMVPHGQALKNYNFKRAKPVRMLKFWSAVQENNCDKVAALLKEDPFLVDHHYENNETALGYATRKGSLDLVALLLKYGADVQQRSSRDATPLRTAVQNKNRAISVLIMEYAGHSLESSAYKQFLEHVDSKYLSSPLRSAAWWGNEQAVTLLLKAGANKDQVNREGETPVWAAAWQGNEKCLKLLFQAGADKNRVNKKGQSPVWAAAWQGNEKCLKLLLQVGADKKREKKKRQSTE